MTSSGKPIFSPRGEPFTIADWIATGIIGIALCPVLVVFVACGVAIYFVVRQFPGTLNALWKRLNNYMEELGARRRRLVRRVLSAFERAPKDSQPAVAEQTPASIHAEVLKRFSDNKRLIDRSPMSDEAKQAAHEEEQRLLESRIAQLLK